MAAMPATKGFHLATVSSNKQQLNNINNSARLLWEEGAGQIQWKKLSCKLLFLSICGRVIFKRYGKLHRASEFVLLLLVCS